MPGDEVNDRAGHADEPATDGEAARRPDGAAGGAGGPAVEWLARRLNDAAAGADPDDRTEAAEERTEPADEWDEPAGEESEAAEDWADRPAEQVEAPDGWTGYRPAHAAHDLNNPAVTWPDVRAGVDDPTGEWPAPGVGDWAEEETDPTGFAPVYGPASDPFVDEDEDVVPGWDAPAVDRHAAVGRRRLLVVAGTFLALAGLIGVILLAGRFGSGFQQSAGSRRGGATAGERSGNQGGNESAQDAQGGADGGPDAPGGRPITAPVGGRTTATVELVDGAGAVKVRAGALGDDLYRISTPAGSGVTPKVVDEDGALRVYLPAGTRGGATAVEILLSTAVRWTVRLHGGANSTAIDLNGAQVDAVDLEGGATRIDLALPAPRTVTAVRMSGGVDQFFLRLAGGTPVRVRVQDGAGRVTLAGDTQTGIAPGREFTAFGWTPGGSGVDLTAAAGMSGLTVSRG